jgi:endonuclease/exonuclease/phosphatase family metal-dependent hydrolase
MEHLWSPAVATRGSRWQMELPPKRLRQAKSVAVRCDGLLESFHGKRGRRFESARGPWKSAANRRFAADLGSLRDHHRVGAADPEASDPAGAGVVRVLTINLWGRGGDWPSRRAVLRDGLRDLRADVIAFQEAFKTGEHDTVAEILGADYHVHHQTTGLLGDGNCAAIACRWPLLRVRELDQQLTPRSADFPATTLLAETDAPEPIGKVLFVNHLPSWKPQHERERELQTVAAARAIEAWVSERPMHVVLAGDLDATPEAASIRFLRGLQSLDGLSVYYRDAWGSTHPGEPGFTFTLANPLMMEESDVRQEVSRRIDYIFVRCDEKGPTLEIAACTLAFNRRSNGAWASDHIGVVADLSVPALE